jgi:hypothetical protein
MTKEELLLAAEHQILGFYHAKQGYSLEDLITGMGLTQDEYFELKASGAIAHLRDCDQHDIFKIVKQPSNFMQKTLQLAKDELNNWKKIKKD